MPCPPSLDLACRLLCRRWKACKIGRFDLEKLVGIRHNHSSLVFLSFLIPLAGLYLSGDILRNVERMQIYQSLCSAVR
jgi:hypothetical protein